MTSPIALSRAPIAPAESFLGHIVDIRRDPLAMMMRCTEAGPLVRLAVPAIDAQVTGSVEPIKHILVDDVKHYSKQTRGFSELRNVVGNGLLTSEGEFWLRQRRLMQPSFHKEPLGRFAKPIVDTAVTWVDAWDRRARAGAPFDVAKDMMSIALEIVGATLMGSDLKGETERVGRAMETILSAVQARLGWLVRPGVDVPLPTNRRLVKARGEVRDLAMRVIEARRAGHVGADLLSVLVAAKDPETGEMMDDVQLRDEVLTMIAAGHETTANALTWAFHLLGDAPDEDAALAAELASVLGGREPTLEDVPKLVYTQAVLKESMRLYPPAWTVARLAERDDEIAGYYVPRGSHVFASIYGLHRNPAYWHKPLRFDPTRFLGDAERERPRLAYMPFGAGPHLCIGQPFAMLEGTLILATLAQRFRLSRIDGQDVKPEPKVTLRPGGGLWMVASRR